MTLATTALQKRFRKWIGKNGGRVLPPAKNEFARFIARDQLCIVYEKKGLIGAMVGEETRECWIAFEAGQPLDIASEPSGCGVAGLQGRRAAALAVADVRSGRSEPLSVRALCWSTGLSVRILARIARANGGRVCSFKIERAPRTLSPRPRSCPTSNLEAIS